MQHNAHLAESLARRSDGDASAGASHPQAEALRQLICAAWERVPFYAAHWEAAAAALPLLKFPRDLASLPLVCKRDLLAFPPADLIDRSFLDTRLSPETTSGSSGQPITIQRDSATVRRRRLRFLRALLACGYRPGQSIMLISTRRSAGLMSIARWHYVDLASEALFAEYQRVRPAVLYGPLTSLLEIVSEARRSTVRVHRPSLVISTAEQLSAGEREALRDAFGCDVADFYGMTELGLVAIRRPAMVRYELADESLLVEFLPSPDNSDDQRLVVTDLSGGAMPLIRYDTGDLVKRDKPEGAIAAFMGRRIDSLVLPSGRTLSPYVVTTCLERIAGVRQYAVIQYADLSLDILVHTHVKGVDDVRRVTELAIGQLCREPLTVRIHLQQEPLASVAGKFRPVRSEAVRRG